MKGSRNISPYYFPERTEKNFPILSGKRKNRTFPKKFWKELLKLSDFENTVIWKTKRYRISGENPEISNVGIFQNSQAVSEKNFAALYSKRKSKISVT